MARKKNYLNNKDMMEQFLLSKQQDAMTDELAKMFIELIERYAKKGSFAYYTYIDDMKAYATMQMCKSWRYFNPERTNNPFAFTTQCVKNSFFQYLNKEKKQRVIRDELLIDQGLNPSNTYMTEYEEAQKEYHRD